MGVKPRVVTCASCRAVIGSIRQIDGNQERLEVGGILVNVARGVCAACGAEFHWSISERALSEMFQRVNQTRADDV